MTTSLALHRQQAAARDRASCPALQVFAVVRICLAVLCRTTRRHIAPWWEAINGAQPGMTNSAAALYDAVTGAYEARPTPYNPFCSGHSHLP